MTNNLIPFVAKGIKFLKFSTIVVTLLVFVDILRAVKGKTEWGSVIRAAAVNWSGLAVGAITFLWINHYSWSDCISQWAIAYVASITVNVAFVMLAEAAVRRLPEWWGNCRTP